MKRVKEKDSLFWLYLLASCWYGVGLIGLISLPFLWRMSSNELQNSFSSSTLSLAYLFPWPASVVILLFTIKDLVKRQSGSALLTALHILCAFLSVLIWYALEGKVIPVYSKIFLSPAPVYMVIGATIGVFTMGFIFTSFIPILCTYIGLKIMGQRSTLSFQRLLVIFLVLLPGWLIILLTGFIFGNA